MNKLLFLVMISSVLCLTGCGDDIDTKLVKEMVTPISSSITIGDAFSSREICNSIKWNKFKDNRNREIIRYTCSLKVDVFNNVFKLTMQEHKKLKIDQLNGVIWTASVGRPRGLGQTIEEADRENKERAKQAEESIPVWIDFFDKYSKLNPIKEIDQIVDFTIINGKPKIIACNYSLSLNGSNAPSSFYDSNCLRYAYLSESSSFNGLAKYMFRPESNIKIEIYKIYLNDYKKL